MERNLTTQRGHQIFGKDNTKRWVAWQTYVMIVGKKNMGLMLQTKKELINMAVVRKFGNKHFVCKASGVAGRKQNSRKTSQVFMVRALGNTQGVEIKRIFFPKEQFGKKFRLLIDFVNDKGLNEDEQKINALVKTNTTLVAKLKSRDELIGKIAELVGHNNYREMLNLVENRPSIPSNRQGFHIK